MEWFAVVVAIVGGYVIGVAQGGINITINHKTPLAPLAPKEDMEYNESTEEMLPKDVQDYMAKNNGFIGF